MTSSKVTVRPPFDPESEVALRAAVAAGHVPVSVTPDQIPEFRDLLCRGVFADGDAAERWRGRGYDVVEADAPGLESDHKVPLLVFRRTAGGGRPAPVILFVHGGGMVGGDHRGGVEPMVAMAERVAASLVSVGYRLAPEHRAPSQLEDCRAALTWIAAHSDELGFDADRVVVVGGSGGGGIAAGLVLWARDNPSPPIYGQLLIAPMLDDRMLTPSSFMLDGEGVWDRTSNRTGWDALLGDSARIPRYVVPAREEELGGLPPTFLSVGSADGFRDEVVAYASGIWQSGGRAELHVWPGGFHGFEKLAPTSRIGRAALAAQDDWLRRLLGEPT